MAKENQQNEHRINRAIRAPFVRVTGDNVDKPGVYSIREALDIAEQLEMDLVEIVPTADPPVCKVIDYQKFLYQQKRKQKELQSKTHTMTIKELRFGPQTERFLDEGNKVKAYVFFKGRSIVYKEQGEILLLKLANDLEEYGKIDQMPKLEGKKMQIVISPKPKKK